MSVKSSAPGKVYLFGEHGVMHGTPSIVTSIDRKIYVAADRRNDDRFSIYSEDVGLHGYDFRIRNLKDSHPPSAKFVVAALRHFYEEFNKNRGVNLKITSEFGDAVSLGTSSAVTVSILKVLDRLFDTNMTQDNLFSLGYRAHTLDAQQGKGSGFDIAAAVYGGTIYFKKGGETIEPINSEKLELLHVSFFDEKIDSPTMIKRVEGRVSKDSEFYKKTIFDPMTTVVENARKYLEQGHNEEIGRMMGVNHGLLVGLGVSTGHADSTIYDANEASVYGGKMVGGVGDNVIILSPEEKKKIVYEQIAERSKEIKIGIIELVTGVEGARIESSD